MSCFRLKRGRQMLPLVGVLFLALGCSGDRGPAGSPGQGGEAGVPGAPGTAGEAGAPGTNAVGMGTIQGSVLDEAGAKIAGVTVTTEPATATVTTDADGGFTFTDIAVGSYRLTASFEGKGAASLMVGVAGGSTTNVSLRLSPDVQSTVASVSGKVVNVKGSGIAGATVTVEGQPISATTGADGAFEFTAVEAVFVFLEVAPPSADYLRGETRRAVHVAAGAKVTNVEVVLSSRPSDSASWVGGATCTGCHTANHGHIISGVKDSAHGRFVTEGTSHMVYPNLWPAPGDKFLPRTPTGDLLRTQDPLDGEGMVHVVLCTRGAGSSREFLFKFYPQQAEGVLLTDGDLDCAESTPANAVWIPVSGTIGGETAWGEGYLDPNHTQPDKAHFGEGKQRYLARIQDVPYLVSWYTANNVPVTRAKQDYVAYMPVYLMQDGTPEGHEALAAGDVAAPKFWQKSPDHWCTP
ncbi:MAG: carboxypeptidase regulatory-like domain-containing protein, partial [Deltaproteobacteria bacterium]|nr:carboxypeptidase regulatory-like domain-containing protein [Deltaproteobacteria bacterium]